MPRPKQRAEVQRSKLFEAMSDQSDTRGVGKVIPFRGNDVPTFLKRLDEFDAVSRKSRLRLG
jgi:hypothetical protein